VRSIQRNLLPDKLALYRLTTDASSSDVSSYTTTDIVTDSWSVDSPATLTAVTSPFYSGDRFVLAIENSQSTTQTLRTLPFEIKFPQIADELIFHCMVYCDSPIQITAYIHEADVAYTTEPGYTNTNTVGVWSPIFSNVKTFGDSATYSKDLQVTMVSSNVETFYMSMTTMTENKPHIHNQFSQLSKVFFPDIYRDVDDTSVAPTRPMDKLYHSLTANMSKVMDSFNEFSTIGQADASSSGQVLGSSLHALAQSKLTNPSLMSSEVIPWAAQFVATDLREQIDLNGTNVVNSDVDFPRWQILTKSYGQNAGTRTALKNSARLTLSGDKSVLVSPLHNGNRFEIMVRTLVSETPGNPVEGTSSPEVLAALEDARPAGYVVLHETLDVIGFVLNDPEFGVFDQGVLT
jgi:hypothetical protein